jgi:hypothetical protein
VEDSSAAAVLQSPELLQMIISEVPCEERTSLRRVSKHWRAVEKIGHAFEPIGHVLFRIEQCGALPLYASQVVFRHNQVFRDQVMPVIVGGNPVRPAYRISCRSLLRHLSAISSAMLGKNVDQFITDPPITEVNVSIDCGNGAEYTDEIPLRVRGGIRLKDVLKRAYQVPDSEVYWNGRVNVLFGGPKEALLPAPDSSEEDDSSESDDQSEDGSLDDSGDEAEGDELAELSASDNSSESDDQSKGGSPDESGDEAGGDEPPESSTPDGGSEKDDGEASEDDLVGSSSKVLQTNELLHMIISEVPLEERTSLRRISKQWQAAVVRLGYALEPINSCEDLAATRRNGVPVYEPPRTPLKVNTAWPGARAHSDYPRELYCLP